MALFAQSLKGAHTHSGFKSVLSVKTVFSCCFRTDQEEKHSTVEANRLPIKTTTNDIKVNGKFRESSLPLIRLGNETDEIDQAHSETILPDSEPYANGDSTDFSRTPGESLRIDNKLHEEIQNEQNTEDSYEQNDSNKNSVQDEFSSPNRNRDEVLQDELNFNSESHNDTIETDDFDNISEHEINIAATNVNVEKTKTGDLRLKIGLDPDKTTLILSIIEAHDFARPSSTTNTIREHSNVEVPAVIAYSVHILVVQSKKQRYKTKMRQGPDPYFDEIIKIVKVKEDEVKKWCLRFRLYGSLRNSMKQIIGEGFLPLSKLNIDMKVQCELALMTHDPNISEDAMDTLLFAKSWKYESTNSLTSIEKNSNLLFTESIPELLVGITFNFNTGRLTIDIVRGNKFPRLKDNKAPDTFIKVTLTNNKGEEMFISKTNVKKATSEPLFEETFVYQIFTFQLDEITMIIQGYHKLKLGKKSMFGSIIIGSKSPNEEGMNHWTDLVLSKCSDQIIRWHTFGDFAESVN